MNPSDLPVAVIGAGPIGLAAAAHLHERRLPFVLFERGDDVAASVRDWAHVRLFSPWTLDIDAAARRLLGAHGWRAPDPTAHPTGGELIERYLRPLADLPEISSRLHTNRTVSSVTRSGVDKLTTASRDEAPFVVTTGSARGAHRTMVRAVIDASGTWLRPNPLGADGCSAMGEREAVDLIDHGIPDVLGAARHRYAGRRVAVVGSGHSAQNAVRELAALATEHPGTSVTWILRRAEPGQRSGGRLDDRLPERARLRADADALVARSEVRLVTSFRIERISVASDVATLVAADGREIGPFDRIVAATGFRPDLTMLSELRVDVDPTLESARELAPLIDPNVHTCGSVPVHGAAELGHPELGLYVVGAKSYGRAPTFLLATGYQQVRSVVAELAVPGSSTPVGVVDVQPARCG